MGDRKGPTEMVIQKWVELRKRGEQGGHKENPLSEGQTEKGRQRRGQSERRT